MPDRIELSPREQAVILAMRSGPDAEDAIYSYATNFRPPEEVPREF